jgi:hypothetical protein
MPDRKGGQAPSYYVVAFSGDKVTDAERPAAVPGEGLGKADGRDRE